RRRGSDGVSAHQLDGTPDPRPAGDGNRGERGGRCLRRLHSGGGNSRCARPLCPTCIRNVPGTGRPQPGGTATLREVICGVPAGGRDWIAAVQDDQGPSVWFEAGRWCLVRRRGGDPRGGAATEAGTGAAGTTSAGRAATTTPGT